MLDLPISLVWNEVSLFLFPKIKNNKVYFYLAYPLRSDVSNHQHKLSQPLNWAENADSSCEGWQRTDKTGNYKGPWTLKS